jgi:8-oxo-dGTP diphosphatase
VPKTPLLTVDAVVLDIRGKVALIRRGHPPFAGRLALPGGFVDVGETIERAVAREVEEETGMGIRIARVVGIYSDPRRDSRFHTVSVAFLCRKTAGRMKAGDDAAAVAWYDVAEALRSPLAFDHRKILKDAIEANRSLARKRRKKRGAAGDHRRAGGFPPSRD